MKKYYTIGEIARYCGVSTRTLRYYDSLGLVRPSMIDPETGYRYYSDEYIDKLNLISRLKDMGHSLKQIRQELSDIDCAKYLQLLQTRRETLSKEIENLSGEVRMLSRLEDDLSSALSARIGSCFITVRPSHIGFYEPVSPEEATNRLKLRMHLEELSVQLAFQPYSSTIYRVIDQDKLRCGEYLDYSGFFICDERLNAPRKDMLCLPEQLCVACYCPETRDQSGPYWQKMMDYIDRNGYEVCGNGMKKILLDKGISADPAEYISILTIAVSKK